MVDERPEDRPVQAAVANPDPASTLEWLEPIYRDHARAVFATAYRVTGNAQDAEDVLQTVFLRLARREVGPDLSRGALPYLRRAATNASLDVIDSRRTRAAAPLEDVATQVADTRSPAPDHRHAGRELRATLRRAVSSLGRRSAEMFVLRYFEELDNREIAEMYETTPGTVAVTQHRDSARLKDQQQADLGGES